MMPAEIIELSTASKFEDLIALDYVVYEGEIHAIVKRQIILDNGLVVSLTKRSDTPQI